MNKVFEKIIDKIGIRAEKSEKKEMDADYFEEAQVYKGERMAYGDAIEIVKQEAEKYEECYKDCGDCEAYNKEKHHCQKFCKVIKETVKEIEENHNDWISCIGCIDCKHKECENYGKV